MQKSGKSGRSMLNIPKVVVILGPNSSGKSSLGVSLAVLLGYEKTKEELNINGAEIISADSRQTYKGLDIGSGKITKKEMLGIPHHMIDVASPKKTFSVVQYQKYAKKAVNNILGLGKLPIIVGGTGFYVDSIIYDMSFPAAPPQMKFRKRLEKLNASELFEQLKRLDPERAKDIDKHNKRRLVRALEIIEYTGKPVPQISRTYEYDVLKIGIGFPKSVLKERISKRLNKRLDNGMVEEVKSLHNSGVSWKKMDDLGLE